MLLCGSSCVCFSRSGPRVPAGTRPSLCPLGQEGGVTKQSSGETRREAAKLCLRIEMCVGGLRCCPLLRGDVAAVRRNNLKCRPGEGHDPYREVYRFEAALIPPKESSPTPSRG